MRYTGVKIVAFFFMLCLGVTAHAQETVARKEVATPGGYTRQMDVVYKTVGSWQGRADLYLPPRGSAPAPVLINMHGGAWRHGNKEAQGGFALYFRLGFAVANVEYRLSSQGNAPAAIEDVRCMMMYLLEHADSLNIDPQRIVFGGSSAGAHLALMAGLMDNNNPKFDNGCPVTKRGYKVAAIIAQSAPSILFQSAANGQLTVLKDGAVFEWLGSRKEDARFAQELSPVTYIAKNNPPVFLAHGDADPRVPYQQSVELDAKLTAAGVPHEFVTIPGGGHGGYEKEKQEEIKGKISEFLKRYVIAK
jgi:acetyl esterase/lipase